MLHYSFRETPIRVKNAKLADAQKIGEALAEIKANHENRLRPEYVWKTALASGVTHPLHQHFEWDLQTAAEQHWTDTARRIIRLVCVREEENEEPHYAFVSVKTAGEDTSYYSRQDILNSEALQLIVLAQADRDLASWQHRYGELVDLCHDVQRIRNELQRRRNGNGDVNHQSDEVEPARQDWSQQAKPVHSGAGRGRRSGSGRGATRQKHSKVVARPAR